VGLFFIVRVIFLFIILL